MGANEKKRVRTAPVSGVSKADTIDKIGEFWDTHDFTDYDDARAPDADFTVVSAVPVDEEIYALLEKQARRHGVNVETLVNLWLQQRLTEETKSAG